MPKLPTYVLRWLAESQCYELTRNGDAAQRFAREGGPAWVHFLETHTSFAFQGQEGRLSVIKETRRRGSGYWYAYHTVGRRTVKRYLGSAGNVSIASLEEAASILNRLELSPAAAQEPERAESRAAHSTALLLPKLQPPRLPSSLVARPRLLARLDSALERKLTLLVAPAGFGKTTIVNQWLHERQACNWSSSLAWVSLDRDENDLIRFWRSIITACQAFQPRLGHETLARLREATQPPFVAKSPQTALTPLLNTLAQRPEEGLLVLDDYHVIEEPAIHETLTFFLNYLPATFHVLLLSRSEPPLPLLHWRARGELAELRTADLRFSAAETTIFARRAFSVQLSDATLRQLTASLQGWVAGLRLLSFSLTGQNSPQELERALASLVQHPTADHKQEGASERSQLAASQGPLKLGALDMPTNGGSDEQAHLASLYQPLLDYFITEILDGQPQDLQHFLLQTSALSRLSAPLCDAILGKGDNAARLETMALAGLFLEALPGQGGWYRFHALVAEALRREAIRRLGEAELQALLQRASRWYEQHEMFEEAIEAALQAPDFEYAARLIERGGKGGEISEQYTVRRWLESLPEKILHAHPMLCWLAALSLRMLPEEASIPATVNQRVERLLHIAEDSWRKQDDQASLGLIAVFHALSCWRSGQFFQATEYAEQALALLPPGAQERHSQTWRGICTFIVGTGLMYEGRFADARTSFLDAYAYCSERTMRILHRAYWCCWAHVTMFWVNYTRPMNTIGKRFLRRASTRIVRSRSEPYWVWRAYILPGMS
ncbi:hypothetical protein EPA93_11890 [Ktedonosporobacter rubrisoli]|uniref:MalT-like winged helix domain-containing protein n=1 Tax=Ktedonosporobacter rubrisoli TaxID=2509675 RepID=A0A4P6JPH3_KTERU|nr:hypothetical protein EPA93_11890 [Ktedonosporobacter rubrisoli]